MEWTGFEPRAPEPVDAAIQVTSEEQAGPGRRPGLKLLARMGEDQVGECILIPSGNGQGPPAWEDRLFVYWLGIEDAWQGKRLGVHLLQRGLNDAHKLGYRRAGINTNWTNHRAFAFYTNFGFSVLDWTYDWHRTL